MQQEWDNEKQRYERELHETSEGQNAIIKQIEESKEGVHKLENKIHDYER